MSSNCGNSGGIKWTSRRGAQSPSTDSDSTSDSDSEEARQIIASTTPIISESAESRDRTSKVNGRNPIDNDELAEELTIIKSLLEAIRQGNEKRLSVLLERCIPLRICTEALDHRKTRRRSNRDDSGCNIVNAIIEELLARSVDSSGIVQTLIESGLDLHGARETTNGRRLWFWAALKDHVNLISYMLAAGFQIDQGISLTDRCILTNALPPDSDTLPQGITALFAALIANAYGVVLHLIKHGAALRLHFHEHNDAYIVPAKAEEHNLSGKPVVVDAMMVLSPRFPNPHPSQQNTTYVEVIRYLLSHGLDPGLPSNLWIKASSIFFMSLSQGHSSHEYVQEISFVLKVALYGHIEIMKVLVDNGADIDAKGFHGLSLLHFATRSTNLDMVEYVAELADDVDLRDDFGYSALHHAVALDQPEIVQCLLEYGAEVNFSSKNGLTPLHLAVSLKDFKMCDLLLQYDAEVNTRLAPVVTERSFNHTVDWYDLISTEMVFGSTPLMSALCPDKMVYVYTVSSCNESDSSDTDSLSDKANSLVNLGNEFDGDSEEFLFAESSERETVNIAADAESGVRGRLVKLLLQHGARACELGYFFRKRLDLAKKDGGHDWELSPFAFEFEWCYPLSLAAKTTTEAWSLFTQTSLRNVKGTADVVRTILDAAKSELTPHVLNEALSAACFTNLRMNGNGRGTGRFRLSRPVIEMLLDNGADLNQRNNQNFTLLHLACIPWKDDWDQCELLDRLLQNGAYIQTRDPRGQTPLHWAAAWSFNALEVLLHHGADTFIHDDFKRDPLHYACSNPDSVNDSRGIQLLLQHRHHRESMSGEETRLALACDNEWNEKDCEILNYLIDPELPQHTNSALFVACRKRRVASLAAICRYSQLWQAYSLRGQEGATPLIEAVNSGSSEAVSLVLQGIAIAYRDRRSVSADTFHDHGNNVPGEQKQELESIEELAGPSRQSHTVSSQFQVGLDKDHLTDSSESYGMSTDNSFYTPPPHIEGLLYSEQHIHKGQFMFHEKYPTIEQVAPLGPNARAACLNARDYLGWTALHHAAAKGDEMIVSLLLNEPDIDLEPCSSLSTTPLDILRASGRQELLQSYEDAIDTRNSSSKNDHSLGYGEKWIQIATWKSFAGLSRTMKWLGTQKTQLIGPIGVRNGQITLFFLILLWSLFWNFKLLGAADEVIEAL